MGMGYIHLDRIGQRLSFVIDTEFWIFVALSILLLIVTLLCYWMWIRRTQMRDRVVTQNIVE